MEVTADKFAFAMEELLEEYSDEVTKVCHECTEDTAEKMVKELKKVKSGKGKYSRPWKKFPMAWTKTIETKAWGSIEATVHLKKPHYRIGHLLEFGHANRDGGRTEGNNFIAPIATTYEEKYVEEMERKIGEIS